MWILFSVPCPTPDGQTARDLYDQAWYAENGSAFYALAQWDSTEGAQAFFEEWDIAEEPGEVAVRLSGDVGLAPLAPG